MSRRRRGLHTEPKLRGWEEKRGWEEEKREREESTGRGENALIQPNTLPPNALMFPPQVYLVEDEHVGYVQSECGREQVAAKRRAHNE